MNQENERSPMASNTGELLPRSLGGRVKPDHGETWSQPNADLRIFKSALTANAEGELVLHHFARWRDHVKCHRIIIRLKLAQRQLAGTGIAKTFAHAGEP
jgi:hypothetical protein